MKTEQTNIKAWYIGYCLMMWVMAAQAYVPPVSKNVHIELHYDMPKKVNAVGTPKRQSIVPYSYFVLSDIYTDDEKKVSSQSARDGVTEFDFMLNHPLYDYLIPGGAYKIPFYVEPGDTLIINVAKFGKPISYKTQKGADAKCATMLLHDFSYNELYSQKEFYQDKKDALFSEFVKRVMRRMHTTVDSINKVADKYNFSELERRLAVNNAKMQYALWLFEFAPYKSMELNNYSAQHKGGWQTRPEQDKEFDEIANVANYAFMSELPLNDSTCIASRYFSRFMMSYEHTYFLNSDQYLYYGTSLYAQARMDSAYISKDLKLTGHMRPSIFMEMAIDRRHYEAPESVDDGSVQLREVQVVGQQDYYKGVTPEDMIHWRENQKTANSVFSPTYWLSERKKQKNRERAKALIKKIEEAEAPDRDEREALLKAYEEETGKKYEGGK